MKEEIEIFKAGTHTSSDGLTVTMSEADLDAIARSYDPELFDSPAVVGHPRDNSPAYAWVEGVRRVGDKLMATLKDWDTDFQEAVKAKRFKKISASFYKPDSSSNPKPGQYYLRHVGFLGGMAPAVKGLKSLDFAEVEEGVIDFCGCGMGGDNIFRNLREWLIEEYGMEVSDRVVPAYLLNQDGSRLDYLESRINQLEALFSKTFTPDMEVRLTEVGEKVIEILNNHTDYTEKEEPLSTGETVDIEEFRKVQEELKAAKLDKKREQITNFVEGLRAKIRPNQKGELVEFMMNLPEEELNFAEGKQPQSPKTWLQGFLKNLPDLVSLKEVAGGDDSEDFSEEEKRSHSAYTDAAKAYEEAWK